MSVGQLHVMGAVKLDPDSFSGTPVNLGGLTRVGLRIGNQVEPMPTSGEALARFIALYGQTFSVNWQTVQLATALDACGLSGTAIAAAALGSGVTLYAQKVAEGGTRASGTVHDTWNIKEGLMYPSGISCDHQGDATLDYDCLPTYDGTNNPLVIAKDVANLTPVADQQRFTLGPVTLGGITFDQVKRVQINTGIGALAEGADSDQWPTFAWISSILPSITISGVKKRWFDATGIPLTGLACTHANSSLVLKKRSPGGTYVAAGTAEHIKFTFAGLAVIDTGFEAAGNAPGEVTIRIPLNWDGTNNPLAVDTTSSY